MNALRNVLTEIIKEALKESASWKLQFDLAVSVTKQKIMVTRDRSVRKMTDCDPKDRPCSFCHHHLQTTCRFYAFLYVLGAFDRRCSCRIFIPSRDEINYVMGFKSLHGALVQR